MRNPQRYTYTAASGGIGEASLLPLLPITLSYQGRSTNASGLLDTGATVNVLPYGIGVQLGAVWEQQLTPIRLSGNLAQYEARPIVMLATISGFNPVRLAFAWTQAEDVPLILGQVNFFMEFDVCFYRSQRAFEVQAKAL
ncbi:MAG TPA: hypothetical protein VNO70_07070 [Blastocatellia bacterium]|nr:hypothetical protein [Blastocatellia bacterium]